MSFVTLIDRWLQSESPNSLCFAAFVVSATILFGGLPLGVADYSVILPEQDGTPVPKQVGIWLGGINWVVIFLVTYPLFLFFLARMARTIREVVSDLNNGGLVITHDRISVVGTAQCNQMLDAFLSRQRLPLLMIAVGAAFATVLLWIGAAARDILTCSTGDRLVFWANGIVWHDKCANGWLILIYSLIVYAWLGVIVFSYVGSLLFCTLYSWFLGQLFSGRLTTGDSATRVLVKTGGMDLAILRSLTFEISMICTLGLITIFFMNLELAYLTSDAKSLTEFLTQYASPINRVVYRFVAGKLMHTPTSVVYDRDDLISAPSFMLFAITMVAFTAAIYSLWMGVRQANLIGGELPPREPPLSIIFMGFRPSMIAALVLTVSSFFVDVGLAIMATVLIRIVIYLLSLARTFRPPSPPIPPAPPAVS